MTKYSQTFKQQVVDFHFEHHESFSATVRHFNCSPSQTKAVIYANAFGKLSETTPTTAIGV